jgi:hypothetical protein
LQYQHHDDRHDDNIHEHFNYRHYDRFDHGLNFNFSPSRHRPHRAAIQARPVIELFPKRIKLAVER